MKRWTAVLGVFPLLVVAGPAWAGGCSMCKTYVSDPADPMARSLNAGILLLFSMPFILVGILGLLAWADRAKETA